MKASKREFINQFKKEKSIDFEYLRALSNLIKEYKPLNYSTEEILDIWYEYIWKVYDQNIIREKPLSFKGFKSIQGEENIMECLSERGVFISFHINSYRFIPFSLAEFLKNKAMPYRISVMMDQKTNDLEQGLDEHEIKNDFFQQVLVADDRTIGYKILKAMEDTHLLLFLDGNTGVGKDLHPIELNHISSKVTIRSGIFRLLAMVNKPICCLISVSDEEGHEHLIAYELIRVNRQDYEESAAKIYRLFTNALNKEPGSWRFWYKHHREVKSWGHIENIENVEVDYFDKENQFGLSLQDGNFYKLEGTTQDA